MRKAYIARNSFLNVNITYDHLHVVPRFAQEVQTQLLANDAVATVGPDHPGKLNLFCDIFLAILTRFDEFDFNMIRVLFERLKLGAQFDSATKLFKVRTKDSFVTVLTDHKSIHLAENGVGLMSTLIMNTHVGTIGSLDVVFHDICRLQGNSVSVCVRSTIWDSPSNICEVTDDP